MTGETSYEETKRPAGVWLKAKHVFRCAKIGPCARGLAGRFVYKIVAW